MAAPRLRISDRAVRGKSTNDYLIWVGPRFVEAAFFPRGPRAASVACESGADASLEARLGRREVWDSSAMAHPLLPALVDEVRSSLGRAELGVVPYLSTRTLSGAGNTVIAPDPAVVERWLDKIWARDKLRREGVPVPSSQVMTLQELESLDVHNDLVVQLPHGCGGSGTFRLQAGRFSPVAPSPDTRLLVSEYVQGIPLNCCGVVFRDGCVSAWLPSIQLLDLQEEFGRYYGNSWTPLPEGVTEKAREVTCQTAQVLGADGYVGSFGVDLIADGGNIRVIEVNPRFQGSTALQSRLDRMNGGPTPLEQHLAALTDLTDKRRPCDSYRRGLSCVRLVSPVSGATRSFDNELLRVGGSRLEPGLVPPRFPVVCGAVLCRMVTARPCYDVPRRSPTPFARGLAGFADRLLAGGPPREPAQR